MATAADVAAAVAAQKTVVDAAVAALKSGVNDAAALDAVVASVNANTAELQAAVPAPAPAPTGPTGAAS